MKAKIKALKGTIQKGEYFVIELSFPNLNYSLTLQIPERDYGRVSDPVEILRQVVEKING